MKQEEKDFLLSLARRSIAEYLENGHKPRISRKILPPIALCRRANFITLTQEGRKLRGCIGNLQPRRPLYLEIIDNAVLAAFFDNRFSPLTRDELDRVIIEISLLTRPRRFPYGSVGKLAEHLGKTRPGVVIRKDNYRATFLPQVWEELEDPEKFLSYLCFKAGLPPDSWRQEPLQVFTYTAEVFHE